jgi:Holliday junction resolvasome RuvABC endonuclease subunit
MGIDLSLRSTGIVLLSLDNNEFHQYGAGCEVKKDDEEGRFQRLIDITCEIRTHIGSYSPVMIGVEGPAYSKFQGPQFSLGRLLGWVESTIWENFQKKIVVIGSTSARKFLIGTKGGGAIKKDRLWEFLTSRGMKFENKDMMDAWVIAIYLKGKLLDRKIPRMVLKLEGL